MGLYGGHTVCSPGHLGTTYLSWLQVSEGGGCGPAALTAPCLLRLLSLLCLRARMSTGWEFSQQGFFSVRATDSSWSPGTAPTWAAGCQRGPGYMLGHPSHSALGAEALLPSSMGNANLCLSTGSGGTWSPGEALGGLGHQKLPLREERRRLAISHKPHFLPG